jgi:hypothetical protein
MDYKELKFINEYGVEEEVEVGDFVRVLHWEGYHYIFEKIGRIFNDEYGRILMQTHHYNWGGYDTRLYEPKEIKGVMTRDNIELLIKMGDIRVSKEENKRMKELI